MNRKCLWLALLVLPLLVAAQVEAQGLPTGTISGRVAETEGLALPGVTVSAKSPALQGARTAVTNVNGDFVIPNVPPGDYVVTFIMSGFQSATRNVRVSASQQAILNTKLSIAGVAAETVVVGKSESISQTSQAATTYSTEMTNKLPVTRTMASSVALTPGVTYNTVAAGAPAISGAQSFDNNITVNGVNIQDNIRGQTSEFLVIPDAIQETTTMTSGVSAEYGRFTGGVINAVTKQGGNAFSGSFRVSFTNDDWQSQTPIPRTYVDKVVPTYEATIGGPIWKDRVWFFGAGRLLENTISRQTVAPKNESFNQVQDERRLEGKLTISPFMNHTLTASYTDRSWEEENYFFTGLPLLESEGTIYPRQLPSDLLSVNYNGVLSTSFFVEAQYAAKNFTFENSGSRFNELIKGTPILVADRGYAQMFGAIFCAVCPGSSEERNNENFLAKGTYFLSTKGLGSHSIVFGYDNFKSVRLSNNWQSGSSWLLVASSVQYDGSTLYPVIDENSYFNYYPIFELSQGSDLTTHSLFVNDTWRLNDKFSFNIGLRWDKNDAVDAGGNDTANDSAFSPRLAANWDVKGDGSLRLSASYATYVGQIQEGIAGSGGTLAGSPSTIYYFWTGNPINTNTSGPWLPTAQVLERMFTHYGVTGLNQFPNVPPDVAFINGVNTVIRDPLKSPRSNEFVLGLGGTLFGNLSYRVDGVYREFKDFYATQRDMSTGQVTFEPTGDVLDMGYLINSNLEERTYQGLHSSFGWRTGTLNLAASWTWSKTEGNIIGETSGSGPIPSGLQSYPEYFDVAWTAPKGALPQDSTHRVRLVATYDLRLGFLGITPGLIQTFDTGTPYGAVGNIASSPYVTNPGYASPPSRVGYYFTARDAYRTDDIWRTDVSLNLSAFLGPVELFVQPQVWNVFGGDGVIAVNTSVTTGTGATPSASTGLVRFNPFTTAPIECPQTASAAECRAMGANWKKGANFGKPTSSASFQRPRAYTVSVGLRF
jgi:outer membrane receptor protein involved in Fe transport